MTDAIKRAIKNRKDEYIGFYESYIPDYTLEDIDMKEYYDRSKSKFKKKVK